MTRHVALKPPCPLCQGRLDAVVRRMPLLGWHMVGLACGHGCDIRWFNRDIDFRIGLDWKTAVFIFLLLKPKTLPHKSGWNGKIIPTALSFI